MKVIPWTVNALEDMEKVHEMGVDGIITDRPWVLREFLSSKSEELKPLRDISLPYHLEPEHIIVEDIKTENGNGAKE